MKARPLHHLIFISWVFSLAPLLADPDEKQAAKLIFEPLSIAITKGGGDGLGGDGNMFNLFAADAGAGTKLVYKVTPDPSLKADLVPSETDLRGFRDDKGGDLLVPLKNQGMNPFGGSNENLRVIPSRRGGVFGIELRSPKTPSATATQVGVKGSLFFAPKKGGTVVEHAPIDLEDGKTVEIGTARLKFTTAQGRGAAGGRAGIWFVAMLPGPDMANAEIVILGADEDLPILDTRSGNMMTSMISKPGDDPFNGIAARGFNCPDGKVGSIKIRFISRDKLIEGPFTLTNRPWRFLRRASKEAKAPGFPSPRR